MSAPLLHEWLAALAAIQGAGIDARLSSGAITLILGGKQVGTFVGYPLYQDAFNISYDDIGIVLRIGGDGQTIHEFPMTSLAHAVEEIVRLRPALPTN